MARRIVSSCWLLAFSASGGVVVRRIKMCFLETSSFVGISLGARHTYGTLVYIGHGDVYNITQIERQLTLDELADLQNSPASVYRYAQAGDLTPGFNSEKDVVAAGIALFDNLYNDGMTLLILGNATYAEPQLVLRGREPEKSMINNWVHELAGSRAKRDIVAENRICDEYWVWLFEKSESNQ